MGADRRLSRFLHLERARPAGPTAEPAREGTGPTEERIAGVERPGPAPAAAVRSVTGARLERFGPEPEPGIELVETDGRRPFTRCRRCSMDNNVFATTCQGCGLGLDTPEQREFDERFWAARAAEGEQEARAAAERQELRDRAEAEEAHARRAMGEAIAREVGESERHRLDGWWGPDRSLARRTPLGLRLARHYLDQRWRLPAFLGAVLLGLGLATYGYVAHSMALMGGVFVLVLALVPIPD
jgi:hypothetical protein